MSVHVLTPETYLAHSTILQRHMNALLAYAPEVDELCTPAFKYIGALEVNYRQRK